MTDAVNRSQGRGDIRWLAPGEVMTVDIRYTAGRMDEV